MSTLYKSKTIKDPFHIPELDLNPKQSSSFISNKERFKQKIQISPGPGSYQYRSKNYKIPQYQVLKDRNDDSPIKKQYQWIYGSDRTSYMQTGNFSLGPGSYEVSKTFQHQKGKWSKSDRFTSREQSLQVGPGSYENIKKEKPKTVTHVFKSKSPKSFIEQLATKSSSSQINQKSNHQLNPIFENPENENNENKGKQKNITKKKQTKSPVFKSIIPRFRQKESNDIGPGSYEVNSQQRIKEPLPKIISVRNQTKTIPKKILKPIPGPGEYDIDQQTIQRSMQFKGNNLISKEQRFHQNTNNLPGPGHYMQNKFMYMVDLKKRSQPDKPSFNSSSERGNVELMTKNNPFGSYNVEIFDIDYRIKKRQEHLEKLKIMQVSLPAFNTKAGK